MGRGTRRLTRRAQDAGRLRADLVPEDLLRIMAMLTSTLWTMDPGSDDWFRYLAILFQGLAPAGAIRCSKRAVPPGGSHADLRRVCRQ